MGGSRKGGREDALTPCAAYSNMERNARALCRYNLSFIMQLMRFMSI